MPPTRHDEDAPALLADLVAKARTRGADAMLADSRSLSVALRLGAVGHLERAESVDVGLRVFIGHRQAIVSSSDTSRTALDELVERAVAMARAVPEDPFCGLAGAGEVAMEVADVDSCEAGEPVVEVLVERARAAEDAARAVPGITNSEGAEAGWSLGRRWIVGSNGFARSREVSSHSLSASVLAGEGTGMERDYEYASAVYADDLPDAAALGRAAGERTVRRLDPRKVDSGQVPIVFESRAARSLLGHLAGAVNGASIARGTSFLRDALDTPVFADGVTIVDDPLRRRGLRSRPFDAEGIAPVRRAVIDGGVLTTWFLDLRSARQIGAHTTGHASRGPSSTPSPAPTNLFLEPGDTAPEALIADIKRGLLVTELIGFGVNGITGDYSRGATGFWIEDGALAYPVSEVTIAGNLKDMFRHLTPANDLEFRYGTDSPTVVVEGMTVAGR